VFHLKYFISNDEEVLNDPVSACLAAGPIKKKKEKKKNSQALYLRKL